MGIRAHIRRLTLGKKPMDGLLRMASATSCRTLTSTISARAMGNESLAHLSHPVQTFHIGTLDDKKMGF